MTEVIEDRKLNDFLTVVDLDGCVSDDRWRKQRIGKETQEEWTHYHEGCGEDMLLDTGAALVREHIAEGDFILFATGRPFDFADMTSDWIQRHFKIKPFKDFTIIMRRPGDERTSVELKSEFVSFIARHALETKKSIRVAYDDRPDVVEMYAKSGINAMVLDAVGLRAHDSAAVAEDVAKVQQILEQDRAAAADETSSDIDLDHPAYTPIKPMINDAPRVDYSDVSLILQDLAKLFQNKNELYGNSGIKVGKVLAALYPDGLSLHSEDDFRKFAHMERVIAKLVRFVNSGMKHEDSIRDLSVYAAMVAAEVK